MPKHVVERHGDDWTKPTNIVGNGPYLLGEWVPSTHVKLVKNDKFYDAGNVKIDRVMYYPGEDRVAGQKRFRAGEVDIATDFSSDQIDWLRKKGFDFVDVGFAEAKDLGVNLVSLGNKKVLSMAGSQKLNEDMRARGYEVFAPDMSMFTLGGGGVHCLCQALKRDSVEV